MARSKNLEACTANYMCLYNSGLTCDLPNSLCKCQTVNTYWSASLLKCLTYKTYGESCDLIYLCNPTYTNLACTAVPNCVCPASVPANSCDCAITDYWDSTSNSN